MLLQTSPPPIVRPFTPPVKRGVCFHVDKPCFVLEAPKNKKSHSFEKLRLKYYKNRMSSAVEISKDPDMNMTLNEIKTGVKTSDRARLSLAVYLLGVLIIFGFVNRY